MPKIVTPLSDARIKKNDAKEKEYKLADGGGLYLLVTPIGTKLWRLQYRYNGKQKQLALGPYPDVTLEQAREKRQEAKADLRKGIDPSAVKKATKEATINTFEAIAREWHAEYKATWSAVHATTIMDRLEKDVFPYIGHMPIIAIESPDVLSFLKHIHERGALDTAHRIKNHCSNIFCYAVATGRAKHDVTAALRKALPPVKFGNYSAPVTPAAVSPMLKAIREYKGSPIVRIALQMGYYTFVRPGELRSAAWNEIDLDHAEWRIPGEKMKMKEAHIVPLSNQVLELLKELKPLTGTGVYLFPSARSTQRCMSENAVNAALRRMGFEKDEITGHGFRAMARTMLHERLKCEPDVIEAQLAHIVPDRLGSAYNRAKHIEARILMMQQWADYLDELSNKKAP